VEYAKELDGVVVSKQHSFLCTESGQNEIIEDIKEKKLNCIVVSA
jgi:heterodisulfide reductase subunit A-like polyferredoxin